LDFVAYSNAMSIVERFQSDLALFSKMKLKKDATLWLVNAKSTFDSVTKICDLRLKNIISASSSNSSSSSSSSAMSSSSFSVLFPSFAPIVRLRSEKTQTLRIVLCEKQIDDLEFQDGLTFGCQLESFNRIIMQIASTMDELAKSNFPSLEFMIQRVRVKLEAAQVHLPEKSISSLHFRIIQFYDQLRARDVTGLFAKYGDIVDNFERFESELYLFSSNPLTLDARISLAMTKSVFDSVKTTFDLRVQSFKDKELSNSSSLMAFSSSSSSSSFSFSSIPSDDFLKKNSDSM
jgi:hypothetical protein